MARCEDFPCCGHEMGCCPRRNANGEQIEMVCVCGASVPLSSRSSLCRACLTAPDDGDDWGRDWGDDGDDTDDGREVRDDGDDGPEDEWLDGSFEA